MSRGGAWAMLLAAALAALLAPPPAGARAQEGNLRGLDDLPRVLEPGFTVVPYAATGGLATSLTFGPDTRAGAEGRRLYVTDTLAGTVLAIDDLGGVGSGPDVFAEGLDGPLGIAAARDGSFYVADSEPDRAGPFGFRPYGRVWRIADDDGDGVADDYDVVLKDLPNGRHNTNGLAFGPDGMLYVTNGNSTDDGIEGGQQEVVPWSGSVVRIAPGARDVSLARLSPRKALVATGWRNVYDLAFSPLDPTRLFVPMNGTDDARKGSTGENPLDPGLGDSDDLLYATDVDDARIDDFGFPSCLVNAAERGSLEPYDNPNPDVIDRFGRCRAATPRPASSFGLHPSSDGLAFQRTAAWGRAHRNDLFVAEWGSLFGPPAGHDVVRVELDRAGRKVVRHSVFLEMDFPLDVTFDAAGALYVADYTGNIFKIDRII
ncbi:MAG: sorbosone dehydrogenase family protein [Actinomycetota bacterium]